MTTEQFITAHRHDDVRHLALTASRCEGVDLRYALDQIAGWQRAQSKLPSWATIDGIVFPPHINMEQCSSEATARYKALLARRLIHDTATADADTTLTDLTGGYGVDFAFMAREFAKATYMERNTDLCEVARHNFARLGIDNADTVCADSATALPTLPLQTLVYADPARRDTHGSKTVLISDCTPDITALLPSLLGKARRVMLKLSPMLDWHKAIADLQQCVAEVHIVSLLGECKELLLVLDPSLHGVSHHTLRIVCADIVRCDTANADSTLMPGLRTTTFGYDTDTSPLPEPHADTVPDALLSDTKEPLFLSEPNASVMKAGCFGHIATRYQLMQMSRNSHLFISHTLPKEFPGRTFIIDSVCTMNRKELRQALHGITKANIAVRNFPLTAEALRKRLKLKDGGDTYIFATTSAAGAHLLIVCRKA